MIIHYFPGNKFYHFVDKEKMGDKICSKPKEKSLKKFLKWPSTNAATYKDRPMKAEKYRIECLEKDLNHLSINIINIMIYCFGSIWPLFTTRKTFNIGCKTMTWLLLKWKTTRRTYLKQTHREILGFLQDWVWKTIQTAEKPYRLQNYLEKYISKDSTKKCTHSYLWRSKETQTNRW